MEDFEKFEALMQDFHDNVKIMGDIEFPITVSSISVERVMVNGIEKVGSWVSIRPCDDIRTFLGIYMGDMKLAPQFSYHVVSKVLSIYPHTNPAIYVPDLKRVVWGMESWWGIIKNPDDLKKITDADIQNIWYMKALRELAEADGDGTEQT